MVLACVVLQADVSAVDHKEQQQPGCEMGNKTWQIYKDDSSQHNHNIQQVRPTAAADAAAAAQSRNDQTQPLAHLYIIIFYMI